MRNLFKIGLVGVAFTLAMVASADKVSAKTAEHSKSYKDIWHDCDPPYLWICHSTPGGAYVHGYSKKYR